MWYAVQWCGEQLATWQRTHATTAAGQLNSPALVWTGTPVDAPVQCTVLTQSSAIAPTLPPSVQGTVMQCRRRRDRGSQQGGGGMGQCSPLPYIYPCPAPPCILLLLEPIDWAKRMLTWLDMASVILTHSGAVNWRGKMMYVTTTHDIVAQQYRRTYQSCYDIVVLRGPRRYRRTRSYDLGPTL